MQSFSLETALYGRPTVNISQRRETVLDFQPAEGGKIFGFLTCKIHKFFKEKCISGDEFRKKSASRQAISHRDFSELIPLATDFPTGIFNRIDTTD